MNYLLNIIVTEYWFRHSTEDGNDKCSRKKARLNLRNRLGYKWHVTRMVEHPNSLSWVRVHLWMRMSELVELSPSSRDVTRHPSSLSWVRVHLWMRTPELVELSPSSLMGGLHGSLATYVALMCKLSMYPNYIPMCSTGKVLLKWRNTQDERDVLVSVVKWVLWTGMYLTLGLKTRYNNNMVRW